jgi:hypothetical protein
MERRQGSVAGHNPHAYPHTHPLSYPHAYAYAYTNFWRRHRHH